MHALCTEEEVRPHQRGRLHRIRHMRERQEPPLSRVRAREPHQVNPLQTYKVKTMNFETLMDKAQMKLEANRPDEAQVYALMAVAERLDRLCAVESGKAKGPRF